MSFVDACKNNDIELAKTCQIPDKDTLNDLFIDICEIGHLEIAKYIHTMGVYKYNAAFVHACWCGHLNVAQWLYSLGFKLSELNLLKSFVYACAKGYFNLAKWLYDLVANLNINFHMYHMSIYTNIAFELACRNGHLHIAKWLNSLGTYFFNDAFVYACSEGQLHVVEWLIDVHYKKSNYIKFDNYTNFKDEIKNILIDNNLINPSTLALDDLKYYLKRTNNIVPPDFNTLHEGFTVKYRGAHTKSALRSVNQ
jgi:hypothetical protein